MGRDIYQSTMVDGNGRVVDEGTVTVYEAGGTTAVTVYAASSGGSSVGSVETDTDGSFDFWVDNTEYAYTQRFKLVLSKSGYVSQTMDNIAILKYFT